jgi:8-oxo-dGTP diphosphatase
MELIKEIIDSDIGESIEEETSYRVKKNTRAVVFNGDDQVAIISAVKDNHHKLPGGVIESSEEIVEALKREIAADLNVSIKIMGEVGLIIEYRSKANLLQLTFCYMAKVEAEQEQVYSTGEESSDSAEIKWLEIDEAIEVLEHDRPESYVGKFVRQRDLLFLMHAKELLDRIS